MKKIILSFALIDEYKICSTVVGAALLLLTYSCRIIKGGQKGWSEVCSEVD